MQKTEHPELELLVKVLNINLDKNLEILGTCRLLKEYMLLVHKIRRYAIEYKDINQAAEKAVTECICSWVKLRVWQAYVYCACLPRA